jgi:DoxX-like family
VLGAIVLFVPDFLRLKEWAYAGIVFELSAAAASLAVRGHAGGIIAPLILLGLALSSWALQPPSRILGTLSLTSSHGHVSSISSDKAT